MVSAFVPGSSGPVRALAGDTVLRSWARHFTLTVPLSPPRGIYGYRRIVGET